MPGCRHANSGFCTGSAPLAFSIGYTLSVALLPTIPTSFVPRTSSFATARRPESLDFVGSLSILSYFLLALSIVAAITVFIYGRILASEHDSKTAQLDQAEAAIDTASVANFVHLRDRLSASNTLLNQHVELSNFFADLETITPLSVRFSALHFGVGQDRKALLQASGTAKNFNALAAASNAIGADGRIKDAIFSNISVTPASTVNFTLTASIDPSLLIYKAAQAQPTVPPEVPVAPTTEAAPTTTP